VPVADINNNHFADAEELFGNHNHSEKAVNTIWWEIEKTPKKKINFFMLLFGAKQYL
jgi:hypothetical protein